MVALDDLIHIYVDFLPIVSTTSPDDALALLIAIYTIFELNFPKGSRTIRLLYCILHNDKRFLTNTTRFFINEKRIEMFIPSSQTQFILQSTTSEQSTSLERNSNASSDDFCLHVSTEPPTTDPSNQTMMYPETASQASSSRTQTSVLNK